MKHKKISFLLTGILLILNFCAWADNNKDQYAADTDQGIYTPGPYVGIKFGYSTVDINDGDFKNFLKTQGDFSEDKHWQASTFVVGWSFARYFSLEGSYTDYPDKEYEVNKYMAQVDDTIKYEYIFETKSWDIVAKLALPLSVITPFLKKWDIYGKSGIAYTTGDLSQFAADDEITKHQKSSAWLPIYELGLTYNLNKYLAFDLSWTRIKGKNSLKYGQDANNNMLVTNNNVIATTNLFEIGINFKFANLL
jgi:hypothetical protein